MLFTDTDSLTYEIKSEDVYEEFFKHKHLFDFSNYPNYSKFFDQANMKTIDGKISNTAKGVNIATEFNELKNTLFNKKIIRHKMRIQGKKRKMGTYEINKMSLFCFYHYYDKRFVSNDGIHMLAYFHKDLKNRFSQVIIHKKRFKKILIKRRDSHR